MKAAHRLQKSWERKFEEGNRQDRSPKYNLWKKKRERIKVELPKVITHGTHHLQLITKHTCTMFINTPGFKLPIEPEGNMSISRTNTPIGAEYHVTFAGSAEWEYIKVIFAAFAFMGKI